mgnify:CR=1 FL=1
MKYVDEFRHPPAVLAQAQRIAEMARQHWTIMEVCGGQTHAILNYGLDELLPEQVELVHGPGCPVCVTPVSVIDHAIAIASQPGVILTTFADMLRVPGSSADLIRTRAAGGDVRPVYSPLDAVSIAAADPDRQVVFFAVGFETTAPATALAVLRAERLALPNFSLLVAHVLVTPAMEAVLAHPGNRVQGFLAAGHVCTVTGYAHYADLVERYRVPVVVTGFEPSDLMDGITTLLELLEAGTPAVVNRYARAVTRSEAGPAFAPVAVVYDVADTEWRGLGVIPGSGLRLKSRYQKYDASLRFPRPYLLPRIDGDCQAGLVLQGRLAPDRCPAYGNRCTPAQPLGAPMVSAEGACAAYWNAGRPPRLREFDPVQEH